MPHIGTPELFVILALMLLVFGPRKLPEIARGFGQGIKEFKQAMRDTFSGEEPPALRTDYPTSGSPSGENAEELVPSSPQSGEERSDGPRPQTGTRPAQPGT